jgi:hypothetical protein
MLLCAPLRPWSKIYTVSDGPLNICSLMSLMSSSLPSLQTLLLGLKDPVVLMSRKLPPPILTISSLRLCRGTTWLIYH